MHHLPSVFVTQNSLFFSDIVQSSLRNAHVIEISKDNENINSACLSYKEGSIMERDWGKTAVSLEPFTKTTL